MSVSVLVVDDHSVVRSGLRSMLEGSEIEIVAEASNGEQAVQQTLAHHPDVVLMDIRMMNVDGLTALEQIRDQVPGTRVIMFSTYDNPTYVARSVALGAQDYLLKGTPRDEMIERILRVATDESPSSDSILATVRQAMGEKKSAGLDVPLTNRETQVLRHIALGLSNREIGRSLEISVETVKEHVQNILRKIDATDRTQAAVWAVKKGLV